MPKATKAKRTRKDITSSTETTKDDANRKYAAKSGVSPAKLSESEQRLLTAPKFLWYKPNSWKYRPPVPQYKPLPKARELLWSVLQQLWMNKNLFGGIIIIYGVLDIILVRGLSYSTNLTSFKNTIDHNFTGTEGKVATTALTFGYLLSGSGSSQAAQSSVYQSLLLLIASLALIWALRQVTTGRTVRVRDSFYQGMYPLVPFSLLFILLGVQLLPLAIAGGMYSAVLTGGIAVDIWEKAFWLLLFIGLSLWSLRMITATVFALYIVTLPDMTPLRAYRSAKQLVYGRRLLIWRKFIFLPVVMVLLAAVVGLPLVFFAAPLAIWIFFILGIVAVPIVHGYLYNLYRDML